MFRGAALVVLILAFTGLAQESITLKMRKLQKGDKTYADISETNSLETVIRNGKDIIEQQKAKVIDVSKFSEEILERPEGKKPWKLTRKYDVATRNIAGKEMTFPYQGKMVLIDRVKDKYSFQYEKGEAIPAKDSELLRREFGDSDIDKPMQETFFPKTPVKPGETWKIDIEAVAKELASNDGFDTNTLKSSGTGKLTKAFLKDGKQFGVVEIDVTLILVGIRKDVTFNDKSSLKMKITYDGCLDGSISELQASMDVKIKAEGKLNANNFDISMDIEGKIVEKRQPIR